eukprot:TRINITY_DN2656_c0_g1_i1.p1 TRINITY_DN2656_c0_g1~~TRINITY_DN2656_c0_g1_i1.p1  ORF type:complete len:121 (+),score=23.27 TRINITY_DN2656_c0_g1_i1:1565-1927(+)
MRIKAKHNYISANNIALTLKDEPSDEIPDENDKALELIRSPSATRRFSNRFTQMGMLEKQNAVSRSSHLFINNKKGNTVQGPPKSNLFVILECDYSINTIRKSTNRLKCGECCYWRLKNL